ncbi:MAG TPA: hypothetical protein VFQ61_10400, partial [Polyangiaceae bacterium]|nr:hypothetical protein [Polyangiaceae bacterium]
MPEPSRVQADEPSAIERPTLLVIGRSDSFQEALVERLSQRALNVETALPERAVEATVVTAPDLIVLGPGLGEKGLLEQLVSSAVSSVIPIVLLQDEEPLDARLRAFRRGAAAVVARTASVDALAERLATLAREIPERDGDVGSEVVSALAGSAGEATLEEFVRMLASELRSGILSVESGVVNAPVRLVLGAGRPLLSAVDEFVARISQHVLHAEPLRYEFDDRAGGTLAVWDELPSRGRLGRGDVSGLRLMLCDDDPARIDQVAQQLRERGAHVAVCSLSPDALELADLRQFDPEVVVMSEVAIAGAGYALLRRMKQDLRLRWASLLVVRWEQIFELDRTVPGFDRLTAMLADLAEVDRGMSDRAELGDAFDARLEVSGPARCLRALARTGRALSLTIQHARAELRVELSRGLVVSAWARSRQDSSTWEGALALSVMLGLRTGRVHVTPIEQPSAANLMAEVDLALDWAERETSPLAPSRPSSDALSVAGARAAVVVSPTLAPALDPATQSAFEVASATSWPVA